MTWLWIGVGAWVAITLVGITIGLAGARRADKPWPERDERWHKE